MKKIKNFASAGMKLMGFKPMSYLKVYHNVKHSYFMYPDEKKTKGSSQCTDALIKEMIAQNKVAIVKFIPRENSQVKFCAMVAQDEKIDPHDGF
jgi:ATP-dependent DNA helicase 2 subunit 1